MSYGIYDFIPGASDRFLMVRADILTWEARRYPPTAEMARRWIFRASLAAKSPQAYRHLSVRERQVLRIANPKNAALLDWYNALEWLGLLRPALPCGEAGSGCLAA